MDSTEVRNRSFGVSLGARLDFVGVASPGLSGQMIVIPGRMWVSLGFLAQMIRWTVQYDPHTRRDHLLLGRVGAGVGTGEGPSLFAFFEAGTGTIRTHPESWRGKRYDLTGIGLGAGYTAGRVTATLDLSVGEANRNNPDLYGLLGISLRWHLF